MKKPCIECGVECEIMPLQLGDAFTLTYLRVCSAECLFLITYEFLHREGFHKHFRNTLYDKQNEEDRAERDNFIRNVSDDAIKGMAEHLKSSSDIFSRVQPDVVNNLFNNRPEIPHGGQTMSFSRPSHEQRIKWAQERVERIQQEFFEALRDLKKICEEIKDDK